ncbi:hypothetical protein UCRPC4_g01868 [Phaeomoniella chlamydospora]|uniref:Uncharacterized protein n=1 Tax=Phaeomoniella chlamydospora TaxID=158046 RepID=A0A0G2GPS9_PHACM|nr:hypothetical protein UCRPC4_g01868 [Phaeomoniella chlamydospora]
MILKDLSETLEHSLIEEYSNEKPPSDGEIYWKIRQYQNDGNVYEELRCWAKLGKTKETRLRQLQKNIRLRHAFDAVLVIPGQRSALRISMIHRIVALKCDEEILHALKHIQTFWSSLVNGVLESLAKIDQHTVETLQLLAPGISRSEARNVHGLILSGQIFKEFTETERLAIYEKVIANGQCLIPSLFQFFEDFKVFECCTHSIKRLFPITQSTVRSSMSRLFKYPEGDEGDCLIQTSHSTFYSRRETKGKCFDIAYRTMWLYSMRYYTQLPPHQKNQELLAKPRNAEADDYVLYEMATLAQRVGFESRQIAELVNRNPDRLFARDVLLKARKPENYSYNPAVFTSLIDRLVECFNTAAPAQQGSSQPVLMERSVKVKARCGHPTMRTLRQDRSLLFIDQMHGEEWPQSVTTGYVRRDTSSGADNPDSSALTTFIPEDRTNLTSGNRPSDQQDVARDGESGDQPPHESINQEADSGPMWENLPGTDTMQETEQSEYTIDIDDMVDDILQDDANQRAIAEHDEQERRRWETEQDTTGEQEQGSQQAEMDRERAMALAQLENTADSSRGSEFTVGEQYLQQIGPDLGLSDASHRITRFDLPGMIARWREASSVLGDDEKHSSLPSAQPPNRAGEDTPKRRRNTEEDDPPQPVETAEAEQRSEDHPAQLEAGNRDHESQPAVTDGQPLDTNDLDRTKCVCLRHEYAKCEYFIKF